MESLKFIKKHDLHKVITLENSKISLDPFFTNCEFSLFAKKYTLSKHDLRYSFKDSDKCIPGLGDFILGYRNPTDEPIIFDVKFLTMSGAKQVFKAHNIWRNELSESIKIYLKPYDTCFAWEKNYDKYTINPIVNPYVSLYLFDYNNNFFPTEIEIIYGNILNNIKREKLAKSNDIVTKIIDSNKYASIIKRQWYKCNNNPQYLVCKKRLLREFNELRCLGSMAYS